MTTITAKMGNKKFSPFSAPNAALAAGRSGIGLRSAHSDQIIAEKPPAGFLEAHSENYFRIGSVPFEHLMTCRANYPISLHGVGLSLGTAEGLDKTHLQKLKELVELVQPAIVSEHISWSAAGGIVVPDLLPLPMTHESIAVICDNIDRVQEKLKCAILVENPSSYIAFTDSEMSEPQMIEKIINATGCGLLLDINNIHVSAHNLGFDALEYLDAIPQGTVGEMHLAGYHINNEGDEQVLIDAHNNPVYDEVWDLYEIALKRFGDIPTLIEWDSELPELSCLLAEAYKADAYRTAWRQNNSEQQKDKKSCVG